MCSYGEALFADVAWITLMDLNKVKWKAIGSHVSSCYVGHDVKLGKYYPLIINANKQMVSSCSPVHAWLLFINYHQGFY